MRAAVDSSAGNGNIIANHALQELTLKREIQQVPFGARPDLPAWLATQGSTASLNHLDLPSSLYSSRIETEYSQENHPPPPGTMPSDLPEYLIQAPAGPTAPPAHMSATALLQKAAQMGATMSRPTSLHTQMVGHGSANGTGSSNSAAAVFGFGLSASHHQENVGHVHGSAGPSPLLHGLMMNGMDRGSLEMLGSKRHESSNSISEGHGRGHGRSEEGANAGGISDGLTRDFLGLRAFSHRDLFNMAGLETCMSTTSSSYNEHQNKKPWHGN
ncbi:hypothetical protein HPP92_021281 [Vanilla planifolia]|uniref:Uncharacterized protein n=1 Tax=Vanilla planifolia TaxID=51239 RepID=A0A835UJA1_VANPL|nr:hypothetical protein HPP92_021281 [Vanilla planifolia]